MAASPVCFLEQEPPSPPISLFFTLSLFILISYLFYYTKHKTTRTIPKKENLFINNTNTNTANLDDDKLSPKWATLINGVGDYDPGKNGSGLDTEVAESECGKKKNKRVKVEDDQVKEDKKQVVDLVAFGEGTVKEFKKSQKTSISENFCSSTHMDNTIIPSQRHASSVCSYHSESANHGLLFWNQTRRNWLAGKMSQDPSKKQEPVKSGDATYESSFKTNKSYQEPVPLSGHASSVGIGNSQESHPGSTSNHSESVNQDSKDSHPSVNHGPLFWNQTRRNWIEGKMSQDPSKKQETFCSTSHMDNTALPSQGLASPVTISYSQDSQRGSSSNHSEVVNHDIQCNHPGSSSNLSDSDHGYLFWLQTRRDWLEGKKSQDPSKKQEPVKSWDATYESSLKTNKSYQEPVPLSGHASSVGIGNNQESHPGSTSNHSESVNQDSKDSHPSVNHGPVFWNQTRRNWIEGKKSQHPSKKQETFCSTSHMDNTALPSQGLASPVTISNSQDSQRGSSSNHSEVVNHDIQCNHPGSSSNLSDSDHGYLFWLQTRRNWLEGKKSQDPSKKQESVKSWDATYESSLKTNKSYQEPVPLSGHASSVGIGNNQESHPGSTSNHSESVNQDSKDSHPSVNHGPLFWNQTRRNWIEGKKSQHPSKKQETFCSTSHMDNTALPSQGLASPVTISNSQDSQRGSSSNHSEVVNHDIQCNHPGSSSNLSDSDHGYLFWLQTRRNWLEGKKSQDPSKKQEPVKSWDATYESSLKTNKSYQEPVPLSGHASSVGIGNSQESHPGSTSNHSKSVNQDSKDSHPSVNHGPLFWNQTRRNWIEGKKSQHPSKKQETFCSTSHMDNTALPSQGLASPVTISNSQDSQRGSSSNHSEVVNHDIQCNHPGSSSNLSDSDHGYLFWLQTRRNWLEGKKSQDPSKALKRL